MNKNKLFSIDELLADLKFMLEQSTIIEHEQDYEKIKLLRKKYGIKL